MTSNSGTEKDKLTTSNPRMKRRSTSFTNSLLCYGSDALESSQNKRVSGFVEETKPSNSIQNIEADTHLPQKANCYLCGKLMSPAALKIHSSFCQGKSLFENDSQETQEPIATTGILNSVVNTVNNSDTFNHKMLQVPEGENIRFKHLTNCRINLNLCEDFQLH